MKITSQKGFAYPLLLIFLAALGVIAYTFSSNLIPFKDQLFNTLYPKSVSKAYSETTLNSKPAPRTSVQEYGFNTHMIASQHQYYGYLDINHFKSLIDDISVRHLAWVRFNIISGEVAPSGTATAINWNESNMAVYLEALDYAQSKGIKVFLVADVPVFAKDYPLLDYQQAAKNYYTGLAKRFSGKVTVWQIFNEADIHNYRDYSLMDMTQPLSKAYLDELKSIVSVSARAIRKVDRKAQITLNVSGYPLGSNSTYNRWVTYFDALYRDLDILSLDPYPNDDLNFSDLLVNRVNNINSKYKKPVMVAEIGMCSGPFSEATQALYLPQYIQALKNSSAKAVIVYEYRDEGTSSDCESSFGIVRADGTNKPAYQPLMSAFP